MKSKNVKNVNEPIDEEREVGTKWYNFIPSSVGLAGILFAMALPAPAQSINPGLDDVFQVRVGPFFANFDTKVVVSGEEFDPDDQLGDNKTTAAVYAKWRITPKLHLNVGYSQISRGDTTTLASGIPVGGINALAGTVLDQDYETSSLPISLGYAFVKNERTEFGAEAGISLTTIKNRVSITVPGAPTITPVNFDVTEPLPSIGLFWHQAFSPQWMFTGTLSYLPIEVGDIDADFYSAFGGVEWRPWKNAAFGAAYLYTKADGTITDGGSTSAFEYQYDGPFLYLMFGGGGR